MKGLFTKKSFKKSYNIARSCNSQRHVITKRDGHCDTWTKQSKNLCVTMQN